MSATTTDSKRAGWLSGLIDGAARAFAFGSGSSTALADVPARSRGTGREKGGKSGKSGKSLRKIDMKGVTVQVQRLAADGHPSAEIARQTALSQDTVALLLHLAPAASDETAGRGNFFRTEPSAEAAG